MTDRSKCGARILMLASDAHGAGGGIAQYNRDIIDALDSFEEIASVHVLARNGVPHSVALPAKAHYPAKQPQGILAYAWLVLRTLMREPRADLIYCAHIRLLPFAVLVKWLWRAPVMLMLYGIDAWTPPSRSSARLLRHVDGLASISQVTLDRFRAWSGSLPMPVHILPNAINLDHFAAGAGHDAALRARRLGIEGRTIIMTLGRMAASERYKGFDEVLAALPRLIERYPSLCYLMAGDGDDRARLESKARSLGVASHCLFTGYLSESEKADTFRIANAYVMPSHGEGFGFVVLEALATGVPVVASIRDGTFEASRGGQLGRAIDPADQDALVDAIAAAIASPKGVPEGLSYFAVPAFRSRLRAALLPVIGA